MPSFALVPAGSFQPHWVVVEEWSLPDGSLIEPPTGDVNAYDATTELTLEVGATNGEAILLVVGFYRPFASRPQFLGLKSVQDDKNNVWEKDPLSYQAGSAPGTLLVWELWRTNVTTDLLAGDKIRMSTGFVAFAFKTNQWLTYQDFDEYGTPPPDTYGPDPVRPSSIRRYFQHQDAAFHPLLGFAFWTSPRDGGFTLLPYPWPQADFTPDYPSPLNPEGPVEANYERIQRYHSGSTIGSPVSFVESVFNRHGIWVGWRTFRGPYLPVLPPATGPVLDSFLTFGGLENGHEVQPGEPGYSAGITSYHYGTALGQLAFYTIRLDSGLWPHNLHTPLGTFFRASCDPDGNVWVRRADPGQPPWDLEVLAAPGQCARPVLMWDEERQRLWVIYGREGEGAGVYQRYSDDHGATWTDEELVMANARYPFAVAEHSSGNQVRAYYLNGQLEGIYRPAGEDDREPLTFRDDAGDAIPVEEDTFALSFQGDDQDRLIATFHVLGETDPSEWLCTDGGAYLRFQRIT